MLYDQFSPGLNQLCMLANDQRSASAFNTQVAVRNAWCHMLNRDSLESKVLDIPPKYLLEEDTDEFKH